MAPVRVRREGVLVVARGDVTEQAGVGVGVPGAAEVVPLLVEVERVDARHPQLGRHADARHAGADDRHAWSAHGSIVAKTRGETHVAGGARPVSHHAGRDGLLAVEDGAVSGGAGAVHAPRRRIDDRRGDRRATRPAPARDLRLPRHARRPAACWSATATGPMAAIATPPRRAAFLDKQQPGLHRRDPRDGQRAAVSVLGRPHRGAADRQAPERDQAHRQGDVRGALQRPGAARAVHGRDGGHLGRQLPRAGREVRLLPLRDGLRRRRRHRPALLDPGRAPSAPSLHELRPPGRRADRREGDRRRGAEPTAWRSPRATSSRIRCPRRT